MFLNTKGDKYAGEIKPGITVHTFRNKKHLFRLEHSYFFTDKMQDVNNLFSISYFKSFGI